MRALITGGAGFIGSHLAERLLEQGYAVSILDDLSTGRLENIEHLADHPRFSSTIGSVMDESLVASLVDEADCIFHLAAAVGVRLVCEAPVHTIDTNVHGTETVTQACEPRPEGRAGGLHVRSVRQERIASFSRGCRSRARTAEQDPLGLCHEQAAR